MMNFKSVVLLVVFLMSLVYVASAQEVTPQPTPEATPESTPEGTPEPSPSFPGTGSYTVEHTIDGLDRSYRIYIPKNYADATQPVPLIIVMHGAGGNGADIESFSDFNDLAEEQGFVVMYPDGLNGVWNDGRVGDQRVGDQDDVRFIGRSIVFVERALNIDPRRIYATGYSMGGMMSYRLACEMSDTIAAIASVASTFPEYLEQACIGSPPVPLLVIQGTDDPVVPWAGVRGGYYSATDTLHAWALHNSCRTDEGMTVQDDLVPDDGTRVIIEAFTDCKDGTDVQVNGIFHGGHTWPGHLILTTFDLGITSRDLDATQAIWDFFRAHVHA